MATHTSKYSRSQSPKLAQGKLGWNDDRLIRMGLSASPAYPVYFGVEVSHNGAAKMLPSVGGITYNVQVGHPAFGWEADHIEPGISLGFDHSKKRQEKALNSFACIGNKVEIISGRAKGSKGVVVGHHGGVEHVIVDFSPSVIRKVSYDDKFMIEAYGMGLKSTYIPEIVFRNLDPQLAKKMFALSHKKMRVEVITCVGAELMGSGLGSTDASSGDFDIQTADEAAVKKYNLETLRLGDVVCLMDFAHDYGWSYRQAHVTFGVIIHGNSFLSGHGPGVATLCSGPQDLFDIRQTGRANIGSYLKCGIFR